MKTLEDIKSVVIERAENLGWTRYAECDEEDDGAVLLGQTDAGCTWGVEDSDGSLIVAPYQAGGQFDGERGQLEDAFCEIMGALFEEIHDNYVQTIGFQID